MSKILLIEDSRTQALEFAGSISQYDNLDVLIANDGPQGLRIAKEAKPALIVLDINLPSMSGFQVCSRLKRDPDTAEIPVIMLTSADKAEDMVKGMSVGAEDYIPKDEFAVENLIGSLQLMGLIPS